MGKAPLTPPPRAALVAGATGLVGSRLLDALLAEPAYRRVVALSRRPLERRDPKLEARLSDFARLEAPGLEADDAFCCLGTTLAAAGSREAFRRVDFDHVLAFARAALAAGARRFLLVSSVGADAGSRVFYSRVKGEAEAAVSALPFESVTALRPSLLLGTRRERRWKESLSAPLVRALSPLLVGPLRKYRPIEAEAVARAMVRLALEAAPGRRVVESDALFALARG